MELEYNGNKDNINAQFSKWRKDERVAKSVELKTEKR